MFKSTMINIINDIWPMILIVVVILTTFRLTDIIINKKKIFLYKELLVLLFVIYVICLFHIVTFQDVNFGTSNYIPFKEMFRYELFSRLFIKNVMGNVLLFIPYGFFIVYFLKTKKFYIPLILTFITSITIETIQLYIGRVFDIDDIILNIVGGFIGYLLYIFLNKIKDKLPSFLKNNWFLNIIIIIIIILVIIYVFNTDLLGRILCLI